MAIYNDIATVIGNGGYDLVDLLVAGYEKLRG